MINYENVVMKQVFKYKKHINIKSEKLSKNKKKYSIYDLGMSEWTHDSCSYVCVFLALFPEKEWKQWLNSNEYHHTQILAS